MCAVEDALSQAKALPNLNQLNAVSRFKLGQLGSLTRLTFYPNQMTEQLVIARCRRPIRQSLSGSQCRRARIHADMYADTRPV